MCASRRAAAAREDAPGSGSGLGLGLGLGLELELELELGSGLGLGLGLGIVRTRLAPKEGLATAIRGTRAAILAEVVEEFCKLERA